MKNSAISQALTTPSTLSDAANSAVASCINPLVADAFALYVKTKNYHWHMTGSHFRDYHILLDEQAEQLFAMIDVLAERVRKLGKMTIHSIGQIRELQSVPDDNETHVTPKEMLSRLLEDNKNYVIRMRAAHKVCAEYNDVATTSILEVFMDETERRVWFLFETQVD